jgi:serine phosphatase RsbU (regulator of sigma subunit)
MALGSDGAERATVDLRALVGHRAAVPATMTVEDVQKEFARTNTDFVGVLAGNVLVGVCARRELVLALGSRFGFALNARQPVAGYLMPAALRVVVGTEITAVFKAAAARADREFYDDVLLVNEPGHYIGMIPMRTLVRLQTEFLLGNITRLEASQREIASQNQQMTDDLRMAREVQLALMPVEHAPVTGRTGSLTLAHCYRPAGGVSGDFLDVLALPGHAVGLLVCDVMGHGVRSALITAMVRAMVEELRPVAADPAVLLTRLNLDLTRLLRRTGDMIFVTAAYVVVDVDTGVLRYALAGHPLPLHWRKQEGTTRPLEQGRSSVGPALGLLDDFQFAVAEEPLEPGDRVYLFTDGLFEAANAGGVEFGEEALARALVAAADRPLGECVGQGIAAAERHCGSSEFGDDVCVLAAELKSAATLAASTDREPLAPAIEAGNRIQAR